MKRLYSLLSLLAVTLFSMNAAKIMTYNIAGHSMNNTKMSNLASLITAASPDVVAIQEVEKNSLTTGVTDWMTELGNATSMNAYFFKMESAGITGEYGIGLLCKGTPMSVENVLFSKSAASTDENRGMIVAEFPDYIVYSSHFSLNAEDRDLAAAEIIRRASASSKPVYVAADFNAEPAYRAMVTLINNGFKVTNDPSVFTYPASAATKCIDMVLTYVPASVSKHVVVGQKGIVAQQGTNYVDLSDHLPYAVELTLADGAEVSSNVVTVASGVDAGSLSAVIAAATEGSVISFNISGTDEVIIPANIPLAKNLTIRGTNIATGNPIVLKPGAAVSLFSLSTTGKIFEFSDLIVDGDNNTTTRNTAITQAVGTTLILKNVTVRNYNAAANNGGALRIQGTATLTGCSFLNNVSGGSYGGGALCIYNAADVTITGCFFSGNSSTATAATSGGGAIVARGTVATACSVKVVNSTFVANKGTTGGAVLASVQSSSVYSSNVSLINCTFTGNYGNGALATLTTSKGSSTLNLVNTIAAYNFNASAAAYSDLYFGNETGTETIGAANSIYGVVGNAKNPAVNSVTASGSILVDYNATQPLFKSYTSVGTLKCGATDEEVVHLSAGSIASAAGTSSLSGYVIPTIDQLENSRPAIPSIGAVEYITPTAMDENMRPVAPQVVASKEQLRIVGVEGAVTVELYDLSGTLIKRELVTEGDVIGLSNVMQKIVVVKLTTQEGVVCHKIIK